MIAGKRGRPKPNRPQNDEISAHQHQEVAQAPVTSKSIHKSTGEEQFNGIVSRRGASETPKGNAQLGGYSPCIPSQVDQIDTNQQGM